MVPVLMPPPMTGAPSCRFSGSLARQVVIPPVCRIASNNAQDMVGELVIPSDLMRLLLRSPGLVLIVSRCRGCTSHLDISKNYRPPVCWCDGIDTAEF